MNRASKILILMIGLAFMACKQEDASQEQALEKEEKYELFNLTATRLEIDINLPAELYPFEEVEIYPKAEGFVKKLYVDRGSYVKAGELLAIIDAPEQMAQMAAAEAKVERANGNLRKAEASFKITEDKFQRIKKTSATEGAIAAGELIEVENRMIEAEAMLKAAQSEKRAAEAEEKAVRQLASYLQLKAPFAGQITSRTIHTGAYVNAGSKAIFKLEKLDVLRLNIPIPEKYADFQLATDSLKFTTGSNPSQTLMAVMSRKSQSLMTDTRNEMMEADVDNQARSLKPGSYAQASLRMQRENAFVIPRQALISTMEGHFVIMVDEQSKAKRIKVRKGMEQKDQIEISGALKEGMRLVKNASEGIAEGMVIR